MTPSTTPDTRRLACCVLIAAAGALAACAPRDAAPHAAAPRAPARASSAPPTRASARDAAGGDYVIVTLPMGSWISLDRGMKQTDGSPAPKGVTPSLTYVLDEGVETLVTDFGEQLARSAKGDPSYADCLSAAYSSDDLVDVPRLPPGSWFCARDRSGHLAKVRIDGVDEERAALQLAYKAWK